MGAIQSFFTFKAADWAKETRFLDLVDASTITQAVADFRAVPRGVWVIDCNYATDYDYLGLLPAVSQLNVLPSLGLERLVLVLNDDASMLLSILKKHLADVELRHFAQRPEAVAWLRAGCPAT